MANNYTYPIPPYPPMIHDNACRVCEGASKYTCRRCLMRACWNHSSNLKYFSLRLSCFDMLKHIAVLKKYFISLRFFVYLLGKITQCTTNRCARGVLGILIFMQYMIMIFIDIPYLIFLYFSILCLIIFYLIMIFYSLLIYPFFFIFKKYYYCTPCSLILIGLPVQLLIWEPEVPEEDEGPQALI